MKKALTSSVIDTFDLYDSRDSDNSQGTDFRGNGSIIGPAWLFNDGSRCEPLKHFYIRFYDIYDGLVRPCAVC